MKCKTAIAVVGVLMLIFCAFQPSQGAWSNANNRHFMAPPNEHPWQDSGSPLVKDTIQVQMVCPVPVVIGPLEIMIIKPVIKINPGPSNIQTADDRTYGRAPR